MKLRDITILFLFLLIISSCFSDEERNDMIYEYYPFTISIYCTNEKGKNILDEPNWQDISATWRGKVYKIEDSENFYTRAAYADFRGLYKEESDIKFGMLQGGAHYENEIIILNWGNMYKQDTICFTRYPTETRQIFEKYLLNGKEVKKINITLSTP